MSCYLYLLLECNQVPKPNFHPYLENKVKTNMKVSSFLKESQFWCCLVSHQDITWNAEWYSRLKLGFHVALIIAELWAHFFHLYFSSVQFSHSVMSNSATPWTSARQASLFITNSWSLLKLMSIVSVMPCNHLILCHPLLPPSIFPSIRVFSNHLYLGYFKNIF